MTIRKAQTVVLALLLICLVNLRAEAAGLEINNQAIKLKGYLKSNYKAFAFDIQNNTDHDIKIYDVDFSGDKPIGPATSDAETRERAALGITWGFALGFFWLFLIPVVIAIIATPIILVKRSGARKNTKKELEKLQGQAPKDAVIKAHTSEHIVAIFPELQTRTNLKFNYKDLTRDALTVFDQEFSLGLSR